MVYGQARRGREDADLGEKTAVEWKSGWGGDKPRRVGEKLPRAGENKIAFVREKTKASGVRKIRAKKVGAMEESDAFYTKVSSGKKKKKHSVGEKNQT